VNSKLEVLYVCYLHCLSHNVKNAISIAHKFETPLFLFIFLILCILLFFSISGFFYFLIIVIYVTIIIIILIIVIIKLHIITHCERNGLIVANTWFTKPKRKLYTRKAPGDQSGHQLDYILVKHRFRNSVKDVQTLAGADIGSDHNLLATKICTRLKKIIWFQKRQPQWNLEKLYAQ
jgi:energy-coupling factor transporter transmembrane protein EcfT